MSTPNEPSPKAGWYDDPTMVNTRRYWDGKKWTDNLIEKSPPPSATPTTPPPAAVPEWSPWVGIGYLVAFVLPVAGLIYGIVWYLKWSAHWGKRIIGWSIAFLVVWLVLVTLGVATPYWV